ncbi:hypothetical protein NC651_034315 [Populus alba x Populus x berolinensis]|nr:hypothetical protein NC651_034315 [Populus alba x Populus x berolinensis]
MSEQCGGLLHSERKGEEQWKLGHCRNERGPGMRNDSSQSLKPKNEGKNRKSLAYEQACSHTTHSGNQYNSLYFRNGFILLNIYKPRNLYVVKCSKDIYWIK